MKFTARIFRSTDNTVITRTVTAPSRSAAAMQLVDPSSTLLALRPQHWTLESARTPLSVSWWCRELRMLLSAGMTVVEALETLHAQSKHGENSASDVSAQLLTELRRGRPLSVAMTSCGAFPPMLVASVRAGERTSSLIETIDDYLRFDDQLSLLRKKFVSAAIYPGIVLVVGVLVSLFLLIGVMPKFAALYAGVGESATGATALILRLSAFLDEFQSILMGAAVALPVVVFVAWRLGFMRSALRFIVERVPPVRKLVRELHLARLFHAMAVMLRGGYTIDEAMAHAATFSFGFSSQTLQSARDVLSTGKPISVAFEQAGLTDEVSQRLLAVGERTGRFDHVLQTIAFRHARSFETALERLSRVIEPVLLLLVSMGVGAVVVMMYMPVFDIASSIR